MPQHKYVLGVIGILGLCFCASVSFLQNDFFKQWFYIFVWWSYILTIDGIIYALKKESLIISHTREFLLMLPLSTSVWLIFECFNLRLANWAYLDITPIKWQRWLGYAVSYATVFPGIFLTAELLEVFGLRLSAKVTSTTSAKSGYYIGGILAGIISMALTMLWPKYFFPLVWLGFIPLLEPVNRWLGYDSLWAGWLAGDKMKTYRLMIAGLICGFLWESWNAPAQAKWVYQIPHFHFCQIFEMPLLGYLGFIPFALECSIIYNFSRGVAQTTWQKTRTGTIIISIILITIWWWLMFHGIDTYTVKSFAHSLTNYSG